MANHREGVRNGIRLESHQSDLDVFGSGLGKEDKNELTRLRERKIPSKCGA